MPDPQKVSALLIYFCDLPDLANLRFLFSANDRVTRFFFSFFSQNLIRVHSNAEKKITTTKKKKKQFFFDILAEGDAGDLEFLSIVFLLEFFLGQSWSSWEGFKVKSLCIFGSEKLMCGSSV
jgi:hypothetical protein